MQLKEYYQHPGKKQFKYNLVSQNNLDLKIVEETAEIIRKLFLIAGYK
ncbi:hypothetical protein [Virgibacillus doumboii]|nr:hypothetical protein [Virgibacillus doumboii]